jgi:hypothetical protein
LNFKLSIRFIFLVFILNCSLLISQNFVKKDSTEIVQFVAKKYFTENIDQEQSIASKINTIHRLSSRIHSTNEFVLQGNFGSALIPLLYENKFYSKINLGRNLGDNYFYSAANIPYFALNKPYSELDFIFFGNGNEEFNGFLSQNLSKKINIGIGIRRSNNLGYFLQQANLHNNFYVSAVYQSKQLRSNIEVVFNELNLRENGGLTKDIYRDNVTPGLWKSENPTIVDASNQVKNFQVNWRNRWLVTKSTNYSDSLLFTPQKSSFFIAQEFNFQVDRVQYRDTLSTGIKNVFYNASSPQSIKLFRSIYHNEIIQNQFSIHYSTHNLSLKAYNTLGINSLYEKKYFYDNLSLNSELNLALGFQLDFKLNDKLNLKSSIYKSFTGYMENDFNFKNSLKSTIKDFDLHLFSNYSHQLPAYSYNYVFNSAVDIYKNLSTQKTWENGFEIKSKNSNFNLKAQYFLISDFLTFDTLSRPIQIQNNFFQISASKEWGWKSLYFPTLIMYQNSIFHRGMVRQTLAFKNKLFSNKNNVIIGADLSINMDQVEPRYNPLLMQQLYSESMTTSAIYPKLDIFATFKISRVHISLIMDNFLSTYLKTGYSPLLNNPLTPSAFYFRANWVFLE